MSNTNGHPVQASPIAVIYARSLLELANERGSAAEAGEEMKAIGQLMAENPHFKEMLSNPAINQAQRIELIDKLFKGRASELVYNLIRIANSKGRAGILDEITSTYLKLLDEQLGNVDVQ